MSVRIWKSVPPPKVIHTTPPEPPVVWMKYMDRCWRSDDGYTVMSRQLRTEIGVVEQVVISPPDEADCPWAVKQAIKEELFGPHRVAVELYPEKKNAVSLAHMPVIWLLPKGCKLPFGLHPTRDPQGTPVNRGYDFQWDEEGESR